MRSLSLCLSLFLTLALRTSTSAQLPNTNIYCFDMEKFGDQIDFKNCKFLTGFNRYGYNNQPQWVNNNELFISVQTPFDTSQTEIYSLSLLNNIITPVTATRESEYSPTLMPDRRNFSCVRVDAGASNTQRLWSYPLDRSNGGKEVVSMHPNVGYHCWLSDTRLALFIVNGTSNALKLVNVPDQSSIQLFGGIGRSMGRLPDGKLAYVQKATPQTWFIKWLDPNNYATDVIIPTVAGSEDFSLLPDGTFIMGNGSKLYSYKVGNPDKQWKEIADLSKYGIYNIKRISVSRELDKIALVTDMYR
jgi:hypothetical protein